MQPRLSTGRADAARAGLRPLLSMCSLLRFVPTILLACCATAAVAGSNVVQYTYDAAGNIVQIARQSTGGLAITSFTPASGDVGTAVTIYGSGFDATPTNNTVKFNGTAATVTASASGSITTSVPSGATTGPISVTVGASTATSSQTFTVTVPGVPTITGFTPASGAAAATVTVTGTSFDVTAGATTVKLNGVAASATVGSDTSLTFTVPASTASGKITATTAAGTGTSATDFIVPPPGINATDIAATLRVTPGAANANIAIPATNKQGLVLFDAQPNVYYSVQFGAIATSPTTATVSYQLIKPDNTVLQSGAITGATNRPTIHLPLLPTAGTYGLVLSPGAATLNTNVRVEINPVSTVDGPAVASSLDFNYQSARFVFSAAANQHIGVGIAGIAFTPNSANLAVAVRVLKPDGSQVTSVTCYANQSQNPQNNCDTEFLAPVAGTYTLLMDSGSTSYGNALVQLSGEATGTLAPDVAQPVTLTRVGQDARYTFTAAVGDSLAIDVSAANLLPQPQSLHVSIWKPDGTSLKSCSATPPASNYCELFTLATAGTYTVTIDPDYGAYGSFNLNLKQGPMLQTTDPPTAFAPAGASETARFRFAATAGQNFTVGLGNLAYDTGTANALVIYAPNGASVGTVGSCNTTSSGGYCRWSGTNLPQTGTYSVLVQPPAGAKMSGNITLSNDLTGTLTPSTPQVVDSARSGQVARFTFAGTAGDSTSVKLTGLTTSPTGRSVALTVYKPDGSSLSSTTLNVPTTAAMLNFASLPVTGNYAAVVDPQTGGSWQGTLLLDPGTPLNVDGPLVSPATQNPGEPLRYTLSLTAGQRVDFGMMSLAYGQSGNSVTNVGLFSPSGSTMLGAGCSPGGVIGCDGSLASAPSTGTYSLILSPPYGNTISGGSFAVSTPLAGTFNVGDPAQTIAIDRPGQTARYTFSGTAAQLLRLNWSSVVLSSGNTSYVLVTILKPDGSTLATSSFANGANGGMNIASLPTTGTYTVVLDPLYAVSISGSFSLTTQ